MSKPILSCFPPNSDADVLAYFSKPMRFAGWDVARFSDGVWTRNDGYWIERYGLKMREPTHWLPLPEKP